MSFCTDKRVGKAMIEEIKDLCKESNHVCPKWVKPSRYTILKESDNQDGGSRALEYMDSCHELDFIFKKNVKGHICGIEITCKPMNKLEVCSFKNAHVEKVLMQMINPVGYLPGCIGN